MSEVRWGILGTGLIAGMFVEDLQAAGLTVAAVGSRTQHAADSFAAEYGIGRSHNSYEALASDPEVDIVYVATPHPFHADNAKLVLNAGKHVLVEKPFTLNAAEAQDVVDLAAERGLLVLEAMWTRFLPHMERIREIIAEGTLGDVRTVIADHNQNLPKDPNHRINNPDLGGGALLDLGIYPVSFAFDVLGTPASIQANAAFTATGVDRQTAIIFSHEDGRQSVLHTALDTAGPTRAVIIGTLGRIEIDTTWYEPTSFTVFDEDDGVIERYESEVISRGMQYQAFEAEKLILSGETASALLPPAQSVAIMKALDDVRERIGLTYPGE